MLEILRHAWDYPWEHIMVFILCSCIAFEAIKKALVAKRREDGPQIFRCSECHRREGKAHLPNCHERRTGEIVAERREDGRHAL